MSMYEYQEYDLATQYPNAVDDRLRARAGIFITAAIDNMLDCYTIEETAQRLEMEAKYLRDFG